MKKLFSFLLIFIIVLMPLNSFAQDDLTVRSWIVESQLLENGDLLVSEDITYMFRSSFNGIFRYIALGGTDWITDIEIYEVKDGTQIPFSIKYDAANGDSNVYNFNEGNDYINLKLFSPSDDEEKTFRMKYTIKNVASIHRDTGEFYYKYIGPENETSVGYFSAVLALPQLDRDNVKIFGHGPLNGIIEFTDDNRIRLEAENISSGDMVEARILYPSEYTPLSTRTGGQSLDEILKEEEGYLKEIEEKAAKRERLKNIFNGVSLALVALGAALTGLFLKLNKRDKYKIDTMMDLYPDDISPAELRLFMNHYVDSRGLMATLFDLAGREYIQIEELNLTSSGKKSSRKKEFQFILINKGNKGLLEHEAFLINWLFNVIGNGVTTDTTQIDKARKKWMRDFTKHENEWRNLVKKQLDRRQYRDLKANKTGAILLAISIPMFIFGIFSLIPGGFIGILAILTSIMLFILSIILMGRKSDEGYVQYNIWNKFKKEIESYQGMEIGIPTDKSLIYAVALGLSLNDLDDYRKTYGNDYYPMYWGYYYFAMSNRKGGSAFEDRFSHSFYGSSSSSGANSTSFGGGGGFSGGGGGGAGGGGTGGF